MWGCQVIRVRLSKTHWARKWRSDVWYRGLTTEPIALPYMFGTDHSRKFRHDWWDSATAAITSFDAIEMRPSEAFYLLICSLLVPYLGTETRCSLTADAGAQKTTVNNNKVRPQYFIDNESAPLCIWPLWLSQWYENWFIPNEKSLNKRLTLSCSHYSERPGTHSKLNCEVKPQRAAVFLTCECHLRFVHAAENSKQTFLQT